MNGWQPIDSAPVSGVILIRAEGEDGSDPRTFVAEASFDGKVERWIWEITTGWIGWEPLPSAWRVTHWQPLPCP